jgi:hypothetical protein
MMIGYSCWGFLGPGILDTPDGGRSHRRALIDGLQRRGHDIVFLQANRDLDEAGHDLTDTYQWSTGLPDIQALFLEWRWPIPGRNTTDCDHPGHTCDLHRQHQLLDHYTANRVPTLLWDKDRQLPADNPLRQARHVQVCEPALHPSPGAVSLRFPVDDAALRGADPVALAAVPRALPLLYVGNRYDRDDAFDRYFAPAARHHRHLIAGKWSGTDRWPDLTFAGRVPFATVAGLYWQALTTILLLPDRYARAGHMTQRIFEAVLAGCLPLAPASIAQADRFVPRALVINDGAHAATTIAELARVAGSQRHAELLADCLARLDLFTLVRQLNAIDDTLNRLTFAGVRR